MNLPRRALAEIAIGKPVFREVIETGGHPASLERLLRGEGDVASIDCVTYAFWRRYRPETAAGVRVLGATPPRSVDPVRHLYRDPGADCANPARRAPLCGDRAALCRGALGIEDCRH